MKFAISVMALMAVAGASFASPNFVQNPNTGDHAYGPIQSLAFQDDLIIDSGTYNISQITTYDDGNADSYTLNIYSNYTDQGGVLLDTYSPSSVVNDPSLPSTGNDVNFDTTGLQLGPGTYILNFTATDLAGNAIYWYNADLNNVNGNEAYLPLYGGSSNWAGESFDMAWNIKVAPTPEPATMALLGLGVVGLVRRRRNNA